MAARLFVVGSGLLFAMPAFATTWNANLAASTTSGIESKGLTVSWDLTDLTTYCADTKRLHVRFTKSATPPDPTDQSDGVFLAMLSPLTDSFNHRPLHARTTYSYTVYACTSSVGCSTICSDVSNTTASASTDPERWLLTGIRGHDLDTDVRVLAEKPYEPGTPEPVRYQAGTHDGQIGVFFFSPRAAVPGPGIYLIRNQCTGWEDDWNDDTTWSSTCSGGWTTPQAIVTSTDGGDHERVGNHWVVQMFSGLLSLFWVEEDSSGERRIARMESTSSDGDDWKTHCGDTGDCSSTTGCTHPGGVVSLYCDIDDPSLTWETVVDMDGNCLEDQGWHGRDLCNEFDGGWSSGSEDLAVLFTASSDDTDPDTGCASCTETGSSDINLVEWDASAGSWTLSTDSTYGTCPVESIADMHDPAVTPYPGGEFKVYAKDEHKNWWVAYTYDGVTFEDLSRVRFYFDDGTLALGTPMHGGCVEDLSTLSWQEGSQKEEVMFFTPLSMIAKYDDGDTAFTDTAGEPCFQDTDDTASPYLGIIAAVLDN